MTTSESLKSQKAPVYGASRYDQEEQFQMLDTRHCDDVHKVGFLLMLYKSHLNSGVDLCFVAILKIDHFAILPLTALLSMAARYNVNAINTMPIRKYPGLSLLMFSAMREARQNPYIASQ